MKSDDVKVLRERLAKLFMEENDRLADEARKAYPDELDAETKSARDAVAAQLDTVIRRMLEEDVPYAVPTDAFWGDLARLLAFRTSIACEMLVSPDDWTDRQILAHRADIEKGRIAALMPLAHKAAAYVSVHNAATREVGDVLNNLGYLFYALAHRAKSFGSRKAGEAFLRLVSSVRNRIDGPLLRFEEDAVDDLIARAQDAVEELKLAADYHALADWEVFRKAEARKLAKAEGRAGKGTRR